MTKDIIKYEFSCNKKIKKRESLKLKRKLSKLSINFEHKLKDVIRILNIDKYKILFKVFTFNYATPERRISSDTLFNIFFIQIVLQDELGKDIGNLFIKDKESSEIMDSKVHNACIINDEKSWESILDSIVERINSLNDLELYLDLNANLNFINKDIFFRNKKTTLFKNQTIKAFYKKIINDYMTNEDLKSVIKKKYTVTLDIKIDSEIRWNIKRMYASKITCSNSRLLEHFDHKSFSQALVETNILPDEITSELISDTKNITEILEFSKILDY